jgi:hypothetical protein
LARRHEASRTTFDPLAKPELKSHRLDFSAVWHAELKDCAAAPVIQDPDLSILDGGDRGTEGQAKAGASCPIGSGAGSVDASEALEDPLPLVPRYTWALVRHLEQPVVAVWSQLDGDHPARWRVPDRVVDQVVKDSAGQQRVGVDRS